VVEVVHKTGVVEEEQTVVVEEEQHNTVVVVHNTLVVVHKTLVVAEEHKTVVGQPAADAKMHAAMIVHSDSTSTYRLEWPTATVVQVEQALVKKLAMIRLHYLD
jgi:hypothetical protein